MAQHTLTLTTLPGEFCVCKLPADAAIPAWATQGAFFTITRTKQELSIVCSQSGPPAGVPCEGGWRCLQVAGPLDFALVGVVASLATPLADAGVSVFIVSTFDTDYLLVKGKDLDRALAALRQAGHTVPTLAA